MSHLSLQVCPVCGVKIENGDKVLFSVGQPGSRARLYARVCNYVQQSECINKDEKAIGVIGVNDYYQPI